MFWPIVIIAVVGLVVGLVVGVCLADYIQVD